MSYLDPQEARMSLRRKELESIMKITGLTEKLVGDILKSRIGYSEA